MRIARRKKGLSQAQMANLVGTTQATYSRIESGFIKQPDQEILKRISEVLEVRKEDMLACEPLAMLPPKNALTPETLDPKDIPTVLRKLKKLVDEDVIKEEEFEQKKKELLARL
jgi:transcriptional regulator with XRE-family HTH domain